MEPRSTRSYYFRMDGGEEELDASEANQMTISLLPDVHRAPIVCGRVGADCCCGRSAAASNDVRDSVPARRQLRDPVKRCARVPAVSLSATSFVGQLEINVCAIKPKLPSLPLATLLRYAYGLRDLETFDETQAPVVAHGFHDLLIALLASRPRMTRAPVGLFRRICCSDGQPRSHRASKS